MVANVYLPTRPSVYTTVHEPVRHLRREQKVIESHAFVLRPSMNWVWFLTMSWYWPTILLLPASAERFVQLDEASVFIAPRGCKRQFCTVKRPLSVEHFEIGRCAAFVAKGGNADRLL